MVGPEGAWLDPYLRTRSGRALSHYLEDQARRERRMGRWVWLCTHREDASHGGWRAAAKILEGDNLLRYAQLIGAILKELEERG